MSTNEVPLLRPGLAERLFLTLNLGNLTIYGPALKAIADERARVCPVRTEAEWRAEFEAWAPTQFDNCERGEAECAWSGYIALARHLNLIAAAEGP